MKEPDSYIVDLLLWRMSNELGDNEQAVLEDWMHSSEEHRRLVEDLDNNDWFSNAWRRFNQINSRDRES
jgi:hypothetical protein